MSIKLLIGQDLPNGYSMPAGLILAEIVLFFWPYADFPILIHLGRGGQSSWDSSPFLVVDSVVSSEDRYAAAKSGG
jgi:hypothetical protein